MLWFLFCFVLVFLPSGALPRIKFKLVMNENIDHLSGDKGDADAGHQQKLYKLLFFLVVSLWLGKKLEDIASGYNLEMYIKVPRISLGLFNKIGTLLLLIELLCLKESAREVGGCTLEEASPLGS